MKKRYQVLIGFIIVVLIIYKADVIKVYEILGAIKIYPLAIAVCLTIPILLMKTFRWKYLLYLQGVNYSLKKAFSAYVASTYIGIVTPGRIGTLIKVFYLKEDKAIRGGKAISSVIADSIFDLLTIILFALVGVGVFSLSTSIMATILGFLVLYIFALIIFFNKAVYKKIFNIISRWEVIKKYKDKLEMNFEAFYKGMEELINIKIILPAFLSLIAYLILFFQCYLIAISIGININFIYVAVFISITNIISLIPITIAGIGTRDATLIVLFSLLGLSKEAAISYSLLILFVVFVSVGVIGTYFWIKHPLTVKLKEGSIFV